MTLPSYADALDFEERNRDGGSRGICDVELARRLLVGQTLLAKVLHDVRAGPDYLQTRIDVQPERLGFLGHSYGGRMAIWAAAFAPRLVAAVSHCGALTYQDHLDRDPTAATGVRRATDRTSDGSG